MIIIKIGGGKSINIRAIVKDLANLDKDEKFIIIHGANAVRDQLAQDLGSQKRTITSVSGYSSVFSDESAIRLIMMAYAGLQNKRIVELCQQNGINAVGLSGIDGKTIVGTRNKGIRTRQDGKLMLLRDFSGKPREVNRAVLELLLDNGYVPVLCIPIIDEQDCAINSENDDIVNVLQHSFHADKIIQLIEAPGFLDNKDDDASLVRTLSRSDLVQREAQVHGRMKRKILALRRLFESGSPKVIIGDGRTDHPIKDALEGKGTIIQ